MYTVQCSSRKKCKNAFSSKFYPGGRNHQAQRLSMMNGISRSRRLLQRWNSTSHLGAKIGPIIYANRQIQPLEIWANQFQFPPNFNLGLLSSRKLPGCVLFSLDPSYQGVEYIKTAIKSNMQLREAFYRFFSQDHEKRTNSIKHKKLQRTKRNKWTNNRSRQNQINKKLIKQFVGEYPYPWFYRSLLLIALSP